MTMHGIIEFDHDVADVELLDGQLVEIPAGRWPIRFIPDPTQAPGEIGNVCKIDFSPPRDYLFRTAQITGLCQTGMVRVR
jgi:hypothetical protein